MIVIYKEISFAEAERVVKRWHYMPSLPSDTQFNFGAFQNGKLVGAACYGNVHIPKIPKDFLELRRLVRQPGADFPLSQFVSKTLASLKSRGIPAVLSYADPAHHHHGGIYQASNWLHLSSKPQGGIRHSFITPDGEISHRQAYRVLGTSSAKRILELKPDWTMKRNLRKYRYAMPLKMRMAKMLKILGVTAIPYPKPHAARPSDESLPRDASAVQPRGAAPLLDLME